jgi:hypothetical protein
MKKKVRATHDESCLPDQVVEWLQQFKTPGANPILLAGAVHLQRAERFADFARRDVANAESLSGAWGAIAKQAESCRDLLRFFANLPDSAEAQPFAGMFGGHRVIDSDEQRRRYRGYVSHVNALLWLLGPPGDPIKSTPDTYDYLCGDARATGQTASQAFKEFRESERGLRQGLAALRALLAVIDPAAKIPTRQPGAQDAARMSYIIQLAWLNSLLLRPQHAAIATLANANFPDGKVTREQIQKAWANLAPKDP